MLDFLQKNSKTQFMDIKATLKQYAPVLIKQGSPYLSKLLASLPPVQRLSSKLGLTSNSLVDIVMGKAIEAYDNINKAKAPISEGSDSFSEALKEANSLVEAGMNGDDSIIYAMAKRHYSVQQIMKVLNSPSNLNARGFGFDAEKIKSSYVVNKERFLNLSAPVDDTSDISMGIGEPSGFEQTII